MRLVLRNSTRPQTFHFTGNRVGARLAGGKPDSAEPRRGHTSGYSCSKNLGRAKAQRRRPGFGLNRIG
jgi:hypothetical protein